MKQSSQKRGDIIVKCSQRKVKRGGRLPDKKRCGAAIVTDNIKESMEKNRDNLEDVRERLESVFERLPIRFPNLNFQDKAAEAGQADGDSGTRAGYTRECRNSLSESDYKRITERRRFLALSPVKKDGADEKNSTRHNQREGDKAEA